MPASRGAGSLQSGARFSTWSPALSEFISYFDRDERMRARAHGGNVGWAAIRIAGRRAPSTVIRLVAQPDTEGALLNASARRLRFACTCVCALALTACTSSHAPTRTAPGSTSPTVSGTQRTPRASSALAMNPFTGGKPSNNAVIAVKIEDTAAGRPQARIDQADIVYIEQVEGGLTRLLAIYHTRLPTVEPVRSTRANDPELAAEFGPIAYVASGGSHAELAPLDKSPLRSDINDRGGPGFARDPNRPVPNNLTANLAVIAAKLKGSKAKSIGLVWSARLGGTSSRPGSAVRTTVGGTAVAFNWNRSLHRYVRIIDGAIQRTAQGHIIATPNVIVQFCRSTVYPQDRDVLGNPAQYTHTIGMGNVAVFRDGRRIDGKWTRHSLQNGTTLSDRHGKPIPLAPGGAWFVLVATGTPVS